MPNQVLLLGSGLVTGPLIDYLLKLPDTLLSIGTVDLEEAQSKLQDHPQGCAFELDVSDDAALSAAIAKSDLVISFVPWVFHPVVAKHAITHHTPMLTASYISDELRALEQKALDADVLILNEMGLDPGLDHLAAMQVIDQIRGNGETLTGFRSVCGGLPSEEAATSPWRYKFSWSPKGALLAAKSPARFLENGILKEVPAESLFLQARPYPMSNPGPFECYPNRDSLKYLPRYKIDDIQTMFRGTLRWPGWSATMDVMAQLDLLSTEPFTPPSGSTLRSLLESQLGNPDDLELAIKTKVRIGDPEDVLARFKAVHLLDDTPLIEHETTWVDLLTEHFSAALKYAPGERDMVVQEHQFESTDSEGRRWLRTSTLVTYGIPHGDSATARTVALPAAIAAKHMLEGRYTLRGVRAPVHAQIYEPVLKELRSFGLEFKETKQKLD